MLNQVAGALLAAIGAVLLLAFFVFIKTPIVTMTIGVCLFMGGLMALGAALYLAGKGRITDRTFWIVAGMACILGIIGIPLALTGFGSYDMPPTDPLLVMGMELNKAKKTGAISFSRVVQFSAGQKFEADSAARAAGLSAGSARFCCPEKADANFVKCIEAGDSPLCEPGCKGYPFGYAFNCSEGSVTVISNTAAAIRTYCGETISQDTPCWIGMEGGD